MSNAYNNSCHSCTPQFEALQNIVDITTKRELQYHKKQLFVAHESLYDLWFSLLKLLKVIFYENNLYFLVSYNNNNVCQKNYHHNVL